MERLQFVLRSLQFGKYRVTLHAQQRMAERSIFHEDIRNCGKTGIALQQLDGKIKVTGMDTQGETLSVICVEENEVIIITVF